MTMAWGLSPCSFPCIELDSSWNTSVPRSLQVAQRALFGNVNNRAGIFTASGSTVSALERGNSNADAETGLSEKRSFRNPGLDNELPSVIDD